MQAWSVAPTKSGLPLQTLPHMFVSWGFLVLYLNLRAAKEVYLKMGSNYMPKGWRCGVVKATY